eukprot:2767743-Prorocentrum_lima.AAC.1
MLSKGIHMTLHQVGEAKYVPNVTCELHTSSLRRANTWMNPSRGEYSREEEESNAFLTDGGWGASANHAVFGF